MLRQVLARQEMDSSQLTASKGCTQLKEDNYERTSQNIKENLPKVLAPNNTCECPLRNGSGEALQGVGDKLTMMAGMMMLLLTDRRSVCILSSNQWQRITHQRKLVLRRTYAASGQIAKKRPGVRRRTVGPRARQVPATISSKYEIAYSSYSGVH
jgi:hypothetical protein